MTKNEWMIMKCKELNTNLFFGSFSGNNLILEQLENSNPELLFDEINKLYQINTSQYNYKVTIRTTGANYYQNWHLDGKRVFETRKGVICPSDSNNQSKYVLHNIFSPTPTYSILYYGSSYNIDFKGGIIEFINGQKIKPMKNNGIIFDSNLGHQVTQQTDGERKCFLIMLFKKSS
jgi:hypothetical protein